MLTPEGFGIVFRTIIGLVALTYVISEVLVPTIKAHIALKRGDWR